MFTGAYLPMRISVRCKDRPFIENNRLARMPELESFGMVDENGAFLGGNCCFGLTVR